MPTQPYHKYVFDEKNRAFLGRFEEMYAREDIEHYDSWFQDDLSHVGRQICALVINQKNFTNILDIGCGKGAFTNLMKKNNARITGVDISKTAIERARGRYPDIDFRCQTAGQAFNGNDMWDLVVFIETLSYMENWKEIIQKAAERSLNLFVSLYIPPDPIGFVKSFDELRVEILKYFKIETEIVCNRETILMMASKIL